jgi:cell division septation protein DedD
MPQLATPAEGGSLMYRICNLVLTTILMLMFCGSVFAKTDDMSLSGQPKEKAFDSSMTAPTAAEPTLRSTMTGFVLKQPPLTGFVSAATLPARVHVKPSNALIPAPAPKSCKYTLTTVDTPNRKKLNYLQKKVQQAGIRPVVKKAIKTVNVYRLLSSCQDNLPAASRELARIAPRSDSPFIIHTIGSYCVVAASLFTEETAKKGQKRLRRKGIKTKIETFQVPLTVQRVTVGPITERQEAEAVQKTLTSRGISTSIETTVN